MPSQDTFNYIDKDEYRNHLEQEKLAYEGKFDENLLLPSAAGLKYIHTKFQERVKKKIGKTIWDYTISLVNKKGKENPKESVTILSLGCGPAGTEINMAKKFVVNYSMDCVDINTKLLEQGKKEAETQHLKMQFIQKDINEYDVVFAHAALHHMINHEHIAEEVKKSMKDDAEFIVYEVIPRNGMGLWDETRKVVNELLPLLPSKYRRSNPVEKGLEFHDSFPEMDTSKKSMKCIRSEELYPVLKKFFKTKYEIQGFSFARRFADHPFRSNYQPEDNPIDKAFLDLIIKLDEAYTSSHNLKPETIFLALKK